MTKVIGFDTWKAVCEAIHENIEHFPFYIDHWDSFETLSLQRKLGFSCLQSVKYLADRSSFRKQVGDQEITCIEDSIPFQVRGDIVQDIVVTVEGDLVDPVIELRSKGTLIGSSSGKTAHFAQVPLPCRFYVFDRLELRVLSQKATGPTEISVDMKVIYLIDNSPSYQHPIMVDENTIVQDGSFRKATAPAELLTEEEAIKALLTENFPPRFSV